MGKIFHIVLDYLCTAVKFYGAHMPHSTVMGSQSYLGGKNFISDLNRNFLTEHKVQEIFDRDGEEVVV